MLSCKKSAMRLAKEMDGALPWHEAILLRLHLKICKVCTRLKADFAALAEAAKYYAAQEEDGVMPLTSVRLGPETVEAIKKRIREVGGDNLL